MASAQKASMLGWELGCLQLLTFHRAVITIYGCEIAQWKPEWHATSTQIKKTQRECQEYGARRIISGDSRFSWAIEACETTQNNQLLVSPDVFRPQSSNSFLVHMPFSLRTKILPGLLGWIGNIFTVNRLGSMGNTPWRQCPTWLDRLSWRSGPKQLIPLSGAGSHPWTWQRPHWEMWKILQNMQRWIGWKWMESYAPMK